MPSDRGPNQKADPVSEKLAIEKKAPKEIPPGLQQKIDNAKFLFTKFLRQRARTKSGKNIAFDLTYDFLVDELQLSRLPPAMTRGILKMVMLSTPGIAETPTGYKTTDPNLLIENFGPESLGIKVMEFFSVSQVLAASQITDMLGIDYSTTTRTMRHLIEEGKVVALKEKAKDSQGVQRILQYKKAENK